MPSEALLLPGLDGPPAPAEPEPVSVVSPGDDPDGLRPYQREAVTRIREELTSNRSTLFVACTGAGKTQTFSALAAHWPGRVLVLAHRDELIQQAQRRLELMTGEMVDVEQAQFRASGARIVVGSVQTLCREARLARFRKDAFSLIVVDEAHHATAPTYVRVLNHFADAKVLGVTATPDRADEKAMGRVFDTVAFVYDIEDGIREGFLCPIRVERVFVEQIELDSVRVVAGDLHQGDLEAVMSAERALHGIAEPTIRLAGGRRTIVFTTSVDNAHRLAEVFCRYRNGCAQAIDGSVDKEARRRILSGHKAGEFQFLINVGVLTEGYDDPEVSCVAMARPTKSRALYTQILGRGLRIHPSKVDCLALDFVGASGRHRLISALDVLGGKFEEDDGEEIMRAAERVVAKRPGILAADAIEEAKRQIEEKKRKDAARRSVIKARVEHRTMTVDPFAILGVADPGPMAKRFGGKFASDKQLAFLKKRDVAIPDGCTAQQASSLIGEVINRQNKGLSSYRQMKILKRFGYEGRDLEFRRASALIDAIVKNGWQRPPADQVRAILGADREAGEEG